jgi:hypothetical protein
MMLNGARGILCDAKWCAQHLFCILRAEFREMPRNARGILSNAVARGIPL